MEGVHIVYELSLTSSETYLLESNNFDRRDAPPRAGSNPKPVASGWVILMRNIERIGIIVIFALPLSAKVIHPSFGDDIDLNGVEWSGHLMVTASLGRSYSRLFN